MTESQALRILVIDDTRCQREAAQKHLGHHHLTLASSYDEASELLDRPYNYQQLNALTDEAGIADQDRYLSVHRPKIEEFKELLRPPVRYDVVLTDLLMPAGEKEQGGLSLKHFVGQMTPVGFALAFQAVQHGAKYIGVYTNDGHHDHPAPALLDPVVFSLASRSPSFTINGARVRFFQHSSVKSLRESDVDDFSKPVACTPCSGKGLISSIPCASCCGRGRIQIKAWATVLNLLMED